MLVLSRKSGEKIHVGEDVIIEIKRISGSRVTVAIDAPRDVRIIRGELVDPSEGEPPAKPREEAAPQTTVNSPSISACLGSHPQVDAGDVGPGIVGG